MVSTYYFSIINPFITWLNYIDYPIMRTLKGDLNIDDK